MKGVPMNDSKGHQGNFNFRRCNLNNAEYSNRNGCSICQTAFNSTDQDTAISYPDLVCGTCCRKAVYAEGERPRAGHGPVFIDGIKCWRRAYATMRDFGDCDTWDEFAIRNRYRFAW